MTMLPHLHHGKPAHSSENRDRSTHSGLRPGDHVTVQGDGFTFSAKVKRLWSNDLNMCSVTVRRGRMITEQAVDTRTCKRVKT